MEDLKLKTLDSITKYLPEGIKKNDVNEVKIPNSIKEIGDDAFNRCENLESIIVSKDSPILDQLKNEYGDKVKVED